MTDEEVYKIMEGMDEVRRGDVSGKSQSTGSLTIVADHEELLRRFCHYRDALDYCLATLKHHHMTKGGISTLVAKTEKIKDRANDTVTLSQQNKGEKNGSNKKNSLHF